MAFTSLAALAAGEAATATLVLGAVSEVGMAMTVVGMVTDSKDLMKIGGTMGLIGGVGSLATGAMSAGTSAEALREGTASMSDFGGVGTDTLADTSSAMDSAASVGASNALSDANYAGADWGAQAATPAVNGAMPYTQPSGIVASNATAPVAPAAPVTATPAAQTAQTASVDSAAPSTASTVDTTTDAYSNPTDSRLAQGAQRSPDAAPQSSSGFWNSLTDFAKNNKTLFEGAMKLGGGALQGMATMSLNNAKLDLERQRLAQTSHGSEVGLWRPNPATPGIINGARS